MTLATRSNSAGSRPMWKSAPERPGHPLPEEGADRLARDPAHDFADEVALGDGVIARRRARLPPRLLGGQQAGGLLPVVEILDGHRLRPAGQPGGVAQQMAEAAPGPPCRRRRTPASSGRPARRGRCWPSSTSIRAHRAVMVLVVDHTLVMVSRLPRAGAGLVDPAAPDVDHQSRPRGSPPPTRPRRCPWPGWPPAGPARREAVVAACRGSRPSSGSGCLLGGGHRRHATGRRDGPGGSRPGPGRRSPAASGQANHRTSWLSPAGGAGSSSPSTASR